MNLIFLKEILFVSHKINESTTFSNGCLGSCNHEERSEMRYVMRFAYLRESSKFWTHIAIPGYSWDHTYLIVRKPHSTSIPCIYCMCIESWNMVSSERTFGPYSSLWPICSWLLIYHAVASKSGRCITYLLGLVVANCYVNFWLWSDWRKINLHKYSNRISD